MKQYLKRQAYDRLLAWKRQPGHSTLEVSGARQVGKTYIVNKFADEQYQHKIYVNLLDFSGELFLEHYNDLRKEIKNGLVCQNPVFDLNKLPRSKLRGISPNLALLGKILVAASCGELNPREIKRYHPGFEDTPDTVVIIDVIQESPAIYNRIREFTRTLKSDFIITGSYLGRILNKEFKFSSGDLDTMEIQTLDFEEFLMAMDRYELFEELDIYGGSSDEIYRELKGLYQIYTKIGGYPEVVLQYMKSGSMKDCSAVLFKIIKLFIQESRRYFEDILDNEIYENIFSCVARILVKEKKGFEQDSFSEELQGIAVRDYSSNITKASVNRAIDWLYSVGIIGFAGKIPECRILDFKAKARCYFMDLGLAGFYLEHIGCTKSDISGIISENFVFLDLKKRISRLDEIALETPAFATFGSGEIDFYVKTMHSQKTYAIEVKAGKKSSRTIQEVLEKKKADCALFIKGNTHGGRKGRIITIPVYGISKFCFQEK